MRGVIQAANAAHASLNPMEMDQLEVLPLPDGDRPNLIGYAGKKMTHNCKLPCTI